ncbi:unnamed protein product, partial [Discosporangium mesarthrocarpum]
FCSRDRIIHSPFTGAMLLLPPLVALSPYDFRAIAPTIPRPTRPRLQCHATRPWADGLGVDYNIFEATRVDGMAGGIVKNSPPDFVVVEIPLDKSSQFTPADPKATLGEDVRPPEAPKAPFREDVIDAAIRWKNGHIQRGGVRREAGAVVGARMGDGNGLDVEAGNDQAEPQPNAMSVQLQKGFESLADLLGGRGEGLEGRRKGPEAASDLACLTGRHG